MFAVAVAVAEGGEGGAMHSAWAARFGGGRVLWGEAFTILLESGAEEVGIGRGGAEAIAGVFGVSESGLFWESGY